MNARKEEHMGFFDKIFGTHSQREIKRITPLVDKIEALRPQMMDIEPDSKVTIIPNSDKSKNYEGTVTKIYPMAFQNENEDNVVKVEIALDKQEESLHLGYTVKIKVK